MTEKKKKAPKDDAQATATKEPHVHGPDCDHDHDHEHEDEIEFVEAPTYEVDYKGECAYEVKVAIPVANEAKQAEKMYEELEDDVELPGFRRGKAPRKLIENKFAKAVKSEVENKLISGAFQKLIKDEDLKPIGVPDIDGLEEAKARPEGTPLAITFKFEVAPRIELGAYRGIEVERPFITIDDKDIEESMSDLLQRHATFQDLEGGVAAKDDQVVMDFKGTIDGEAFSGGSAENYPYILGSGRFFPEFETAMLGASPGDDVTCEVTFPEDYMAAELRGKTAQFAISIKEVKRKQIPTLDDDFAKEAGYENEANLRETMKAQLEDAAKERSRQFAENNALEAVVEKSTFEIPNTMIERIANDYIQQEVRRLAQMHTPIGNIEERMATITAEARESAARNIKMMVALNEIGETEGVDVTEEDFEKEAASMAKSIGAEVEMVARYLAQSEERGQYIDRIYRKKVLDVILDNAKITDKELTREEMEEREKEAQESSGSDA